MEREPAGGRTLARVANAVVALALLTLGVLGAVSGSIYAGVALGALGVVAIPGILYPRYNFLWWALEGWGLP